jgi:lipase chaperone LimK
MVAMATTAFLLWPSEQTVTANDDRQDHMRFDNKPMRALAAPEHGTTGTTPSPTSLSGTEPDGDISVTISPGTIRFFDYYLTTLGETDLAGVRALVATEAQRRSSDNARDVLALFDRYARYLGELDIIYAPTIDSYFAQIIALQQRHFGGDAETLFGADNAVAARLIAAAAK